MPGDGKNRPRYLLPDTLHPTGHNGLSRRLVERADEQKQYDLLRQRACGSREYKNPPALGVLDFARGGVYRRARWPRIGPWRSAQREPLHDSTIISPGPSPLALCG